MTTTEGRFVGYVPLPDVQLAPRNPKAHDATAIARSIGHFGFAELPLVDERTGRLVAGHGRYDQLVALKAGGATPPDGVRVGDDGEWEMPVVRGWASRSDEDAEAYLIASNNITTIGGWDERLLAELLGDLADSQLLELTGFDADGLEDLLASIQEADLPPPVALTEPDDEPARPVKPRTREGDVWLLGPHRVLCGDATDQTAVEDMLDGDRCDVAWTDPPYGVDYVGGTADALTIRNDSAVGLSELLRDMLPVATAGLKPGAPFYIAHPPGPLAYVFFTAVQRAGWLLRQGLVWVKDHFVLGRSDYHYQHEAVMYGFVPGGQGRLGRGGPRWFGDDAQTTVFEVPKPRISEDHPTKKPVKLITAHLTNSCRPGGLVLDLFGGSGSTLIAAHHHGAVARLVELDPRFVDVICRRWQEHTGVLPVLRSTGEEVDFAERANP
ncbi:DNA modification methylase [Saccharothrix xinjiangensis]|uniref:DNA modification methylase n=1 Tax=Saccharothrix xinjiangensis TaxID=204798 RepID=A0ABV9XWN1_9PSEU